jgi:hypothetical protein
MTFTKRLREGVRRDEITCSVRIWTRPHVTVGTRYRMEEGEIEIDSIQPIGFPDITPQLPRASGFLGILDLLKVAKHGKGENIYLVRFHYIPPTRHKVQRPKPRSKSLYREITKQTRVSSPQVIYLHDSQGHRNGRTPRQKVWLLCNCNRMRRLRPLLRLR